MKKFAKRLRCIFFLQTYNLIFKKGFFFHFLLDSQQLIRCNLRSRETRQIFIIVATISVFLVVGLFFVLDSGTKNESVAPSESHIPSESESEKNENFYQNVKKRHILHKKEHSHRIKRQISDIDPVEYGHNDYINVRRKRLIERLHQVKEQFDRCVKSQNNKVDCDKFYHEITSITGALKHGIETIEKLTQNIHDHNQNQNHMFQSADTNRKIHEDSVKVGHPLSDLNQEDIVQRIREFTPFPRFHEDMDNGRVNLFNMDEQVRNTHPPFSPSGMPIHRPNPVQTSLRDNEKVTTLKNNFGKYNFDYILLKLGHQKK